jgi:hypothetical protein
MSPKVSVTAQVDDLLRGLPALGSVTDADLREELVACEQASQMLLGRQAEVMAEMGRRAAAADRAEEHQIGRPLAPHGGRAEFVADEIGATLTQTRVAATRRYQLAIEAARCPTVMRAWRAGRIDQRRVEAVTDALRDVQPVFAETFAEAALVYAETHTAPQLRQWLARRVVAADPAAAEVRRARATAERRVTVSPRGDGVSELLALLPSLQARQIYETVDTLAHAAPSEDVRTMDQRRADALFDLLTGRADPPSVSVQVVVPADTLLAESAMPGFVPGVGPITAGQAVSLALPGACPDEREVDVVTWRRLLTDPSDGTLLDAAEKSYRPSARLQRAVRARDVTCRFPGCRRPAGGARSGTDLDHVTPWPVGPTSAANLMVLCRHHHRVKHSPGWSVELLRDGKVAWTTPGGRRLVTEPWRYTDQDDDLRVPT